MSNPFNDYQTDILFLLVGSNPLPDYVATHLLAKDTVVLLHSTRTTRVAERLARQLRKERQNLAVHFYTVPESDGPVIASEVEKAVRSFPAGKTVGLNYTGGTKPMAVYSYRSLVQMSLRTVFSYLDARTLSMVIDPGSGPVQRIPVGRQISMTLEQIASLHGYEIKESRKSPRNKLIADAIAQVHLAPDGMQQWRDWLNTWSSSSGASLPDMNRFPALTPVIQAFAHVCRGSATESGVAAALGFQRLNQCGKYFVGGWLEDYVLDALTQVSQQLHVDDYACEILLRASRQPDFELDAALTIGYQLFAISCIVTEKKSAAKEHFLELFIRAGQLGGDEARFAAVTFCDNSNVKALYSEVTEAWDAVGKIRVFGRHHIRNLSAHLLQWFRDANQGTP